MKKTRHWMLLVPLLMMLCMLVVTTTSTPYQGPGSTTTAVVKDTCILTDLVATNLAPPATTFAGHENAIIGEHASKVAPTGLREFLDTKMTSMVQVASVPATAGFYLRV